MYPDVSDVVFNKVLLAIRQTVYVEGRTLMPETRLVEDLKLGRFGRIRLALYLEENFDVEIADDAVERFVTIGDIVLHMGRWVLHTTEPASQTWVIAGN